MTRSAVDVFISYSHEDEEFLNELEVHLALLKREGLIRTWHDRKITPGEQWRVELDDHLEDAGLILLLVSASFIGSDYCWEVEVTKALDRHARGEVRVVPILVRSCDWETAPFADIQGLPANLEPVSLWRDRDSAWRDVVQGLRKTIAVLEEGAPRYPDEESRVLSGKLKELYRRKKGLTVAGGTTDLVDSQILEIRRQLRHGPQLRPGELLLDGRFELIEVIGQGGFAIVWRAWDNTLGRLVALKVLHGQYAGDRSRRERFFRGAREMAGLEHQHIVQVFEKELLDDGWYFYVMEYLAGRNFEQAVREGRLTKAQRLEIVLQIGEALTFAHRKGIVHRDVKPTNILLDEAHQAKLTDFDLVRAEDTTGLTRTRAMMGTLQFAAPEALTSAGTAGPAADVYSLGSTAVVAVSGKPLPADYFRSPDGVIAELTCSKPLKRVLRRATAFAVKERHSSSVEGFCEDLEAAAFDPPAVAAKRPWARAFLATTALATLILVVVLSSRLGPRESMDPSMSSPLESTTDGATNQTASPYPEGSSIKARVNIADELKHLKFELQTNSLLVALKAGDLVAIPEDSIHRDPFGPMASVDIFVGGHPAKALFKIDDDQPSISPSFYRVIDIRTEPCTTSGIVARIDVALSDIVSWKVEDAQSGSTVPFIYGAEHLIAVKADNFESVAIKDVPQAVSTTAIRELRATLSADKLARTFKLIELEACGEAPAGPVAGETLTVGGHAARSAADGTFQVTSSVLPSSTEMKMAPESIYEIVKSLDLNATRHRRIDLGKWNGEEACEVSEILLRRKRLNGERPVPILDLGDFTRRMSSLEHVEVKVRGHCPGQRPRALDKGSLDIGDDGRVFLQPSGYTTMDREVIVSYSSHSEYETFSSVLSLDSSQRQRPRKLERRLPGVMVVVSATSVLGKVYDQLVDPLVEFLTRETSLNHKVAVARSFGPDFYESIDLPANGKPAAIRQALSSLVIDSESDPDPVQDLSEASETLTTFNDDVEDYQNKLLYIVPSAPICKMIPSKAINRHAETMDVIVFEIRTEAWRAGVCLDFPGLTHHYVQPEDLLEILTREARRWRYPIPL